MGSAVKRGRTGGLEGPGVGRAGSADHYIQYIAPACYSTVWLDDPCPRRFGSWVAYRGFAGRAKLDRHTYVFTILVVAHAAQAAATNDRQWIGMSGEPGISLVQQRRGLMDTPSIIQLLLRGAVNLHTYVGWKRMLLGCKPDLLP